MPKPKIVVVGSINMDLVQQVDRLPAPGETIAGGALAYIPGGKGANQAVAAARLGADVHLVGRVGTDGFGHTLRAGLVKSGVNTQFVTDRSGASGTALILVQSGGDNSIVIAGGANARLSVSDVKRATSVIRVADVVLLQLEIPLEVVLFTIDLCQKLGVRVILDPAPAAAGLPDELFNVDVICPNESEAMTLLGRTFKEPTGYARALQQRGASAVVLKQGAAGSSYLGDEDELLQVKAFKVKVIDTTAAGDSMTAGLAVALGEGKPWQDALRFANAAGALACTVKGAQPSLPTRSKVLSMLQRNR